MATSAAEFEAYVGRSPYHSPRDVGISVPGYEEWGAPERTVVCLAHSGDAEPLIGSGKGTEAASGAG